MCEGYALAERMLRDYRDPAPGPLAGIGTGLARLRQLARGLYRAVVRH